MTFEEKAAEWSRLWMPPQRLKLSEWAERHFVTSSEYSSRSGPLRLFGWQREVLDAFTDPRVSKVVLMTGTQLIKTLAQQVALAYVITEAPGPILFGEPAEDDAKAFSRDRLTPMARDIPCLRGKLAEPKSRSGDNTIQFKTFPGGNLSLVSASVPRNWSRRSIRYLFCDEIDKSGYDAGPEGDPISLGEQRTSTFGSLKKIILACSPTVKGKRIDLAYEASDQRKPWVACPVCGERQILRWDHVKWDSTLPEVWQPASAHYECECCAAHWSDVQRWKACEGAEWRAARPFNGTAGFWISHLYSPWETLADLVKRWLVQHSDPAQLQVFVNTDLAEFWEERGDAPPWEVIKARAEDYELGYAPAGALVLTAGIDVQRTWLTCDIWGWGRNRERWLVDSYDIEGNTAHPATWAQLTERLHQTYKRVGGGEISIRRAAVDTGDEQYNSEALYAWIKQQGPAFVMAVKGQAQGEAFVGIPRKPESTQAGKQAKFGVRIWPVNVSMGKARLYAQLNLPRDGSTAAPGTVHCPRMSDEWFQQLVAETYVVRTVKGYHKGEWIKTRTRNEALDKANYAAAAAYVLGTHSWREDRWAASEQFIAKNRTAPTDDPSAPGLPSPAARSRTSSSTWMRSFLG